jgi:hypothetical protein
MVETNTKRIALGGLKGRADEANSGYFAVRELLAKSASISPTVTLEVVTDSDQSMGCSRAFFKLCHGRSFCTPMPVGVERSSVSS